MEMYNEITNAMWASVPKAFFEAVVRIWWLFAMILAVIAVRLYLALKHDVRTPLEFAGLVKKLLTKKEKIEPVFIDTLKGKEFPVDFSWGGNFTYYKFGRFGKIDFEKKNSKAKNAFKLLTDAKGEFVETQLIAKQLGCSPDKARATLNNLQNKLKNYPKLSPFIGIESYGKGAYRLAVKRRILEQEHND
jgi:hypothetical protein